jgi:hypothetical protein
MQLIRNLTWRLIALTFVGLFCYALLPLFINSGEGFAPLPISTFYGTVAALIVGFVMPIKQLQKVETLSHEVGHALAASLVGLSIRLIRIERDTSGVTQFNGRMSRLRSLIVSASGPLGTVSFFVFTAALIANDQAVLWILFALVATFLITVTTVRSIWGWLSSTLVIVALGQSLIVAFGQSLWATIQIGSENIGEVTFGIWPNSTWNLAILVSAYCCGISLAYSIKCRKPRSESQDEARVGRALGMHPIMGGYLILILNIVLIFIAVTIILGWVNPWSPSPLDIG